MKSEALHVSALQLKNLASDNSCFALSYLYHESDFVISNTYSSYFSMRSCEFAFELCSTRNGAIIGSKRKIQFETLRQAYLRFHFNVEHYKELTCELLLKLI